MILEMEDNGFVVSLLYKSVKSGEQSVPPELEKAGQKFEEII